MRRAFNQGTVASLQISQRPQFRIKGTACPAFFWSDGKMARRAGFEPPQACGSLGRENGAYKKGLQKIRTRSNVGPWSILLLRIGCSTAVRLPVPPNGAEEAAEKYRPIFPRNPLISLDSDERIQGNPRKSNTRNRALSQSNATGQENPNAPPCEARAGGCPRTAALQALSPARGRLEAAPARPYFARIASSSSATMLVILIAGLTAGPAVSL